MPGRLRGSVERPGSEIVTKDVLILDFGTDKAPCRGERAIMEQQGRVISGFELIRDWGENILIEELLDIFSADCKEAGFEFVKNCGGSIVKPNFLPSRMIDSKLLLKSIVPYGNVFVRLLTEFQSEKQPSGPAQTRITDCIDMNSNADEKKDTSVSEPGELQGDSAVEASSLANDNCSKAPFDIDKIINEMPELKNHVKILRYLQKEMVQGRPLEIMAENEMLTGDTNFISIDRLNILETTFLVNLLMLPIHS